jgi:hypothetical protein
MVYLVPTLSTASKFMHLYLSKTEDAICPDLVDCAKMYIR